MTESLALRRAGKRLVTIAALVAFAWVLVETEVTSESGAMATALLGFVLLTAFLAGAVARGMGLPAVTGFVLVGIAVGPSGIGVLHGEVVEQLRRIDEIALALIALMAGGELRMGELRKAFRSIVGITLSVGGVVVIGMLAMVLVMRPFVPFLADQSWGVTIAVGLLLAIWSANSSPDATIAVINETGASGELTETILGVTIFKDVLVIVGFAAALTLTGPLVKPGGAFDATVLGVVAWEVGGALLLGSLAGVVFGFYLERIGARSALATLAFTFVLVLLAEMLHMELLLTAVGAGFIIENFTEAGDDLIQAIEANAMAVFAIFFALAGAALSLETLRAYWLTALVIVLVRGGLTWAGAQLGARVTDSSPLVTRWTWMGIISQAGVTLGLSLLVARELPAIGETFVAVTTAVIIVHLLVGPVLLKIALERAGEGQSRERAGDPADALADAVG